jgi:anti-sigma factor RsiW
VISHGSCGEVRQALAVYVLGAIEPADRTVVDRHLGDCVDCREELAGFAPLPALLRRVSVEEASALVDDARGNPRDDQPPRPALQYMLVQAGRRRTRDLRARAIAAAAVGLLAGAGGIAAWHATHPVPPRPLSAAAPGWSMTPRAADPVTRVSATVRYSARPWGLQASVQVTGIPAGTMCQVDVVSRQGLVTIAGGWTLTSGPANWYPASSAVAPSDVRAFTVSSGSKILVTVPIRPDAAHTGRVS